MRSESNQPSAVGGAIRDDTLSMIGHDQRATDDSRSVTPKSPTIPSSDLSQDAATGVQDRMKSDPSLIQNYQGFDRNRQLAETLDSSLLPSINTAADFQTTNSSYQEVQIRRASQPHHHSSPATAGLQIRTDIQPSSSTTTQKQSTVSSNSSSGASYGTPVVGVATSPEFLIPALHHAISTGSLAGTLSPNTAIASPALAAMLTGIDITPLPSPIMPGDSSPTPWERVRSGDAREVASGSSSSSSGPAARRMTNENAAPPRLNGPLSPGTPPKKKKGYGSLLPTAVEAQAANAAAIEQNRRAQSHGRHRSISDFVPEALQNVRQRVATIGHDGFNLGTPSADAPMHREHYLAAERGLVSAPPTIDSTQTLPSPPPSNKSVTDLELDNEEMEPSAEYFIVRSASNASRKRKWRAVRPLGQGTFSKVVLATSERLPRGAEYTEENLDPGKLVAVKIVEHGPAGGADEERIEVSLKREVDILKSVSHASIVNLKALEYTEARALLVLTYCPGGDLFDLASGKNNVLSPVLVQRMFSELVSAVRYLHTNYIVHRDIKLENVLVNPNPAFLSTISDPANYPSSIICLTDLGLSRRIPLPPASPLLTTRCGSEDYAAPEILLGQPYDGRSTDSWALGVLLYALMEGRLPFDTPPGKPERSRVSHRVARCDWIWCKFGDEDGDWDDSKPGAAEWSGGKMVVEALLKKVRMGRKTLGEVEDMEWVKEGVRVPGGLKVVDDEV